MVKNPSSFIFWCGGVLTLTTKGTLLAPPTIWAVGGRISRPVANKQLTLLLGLCCRDHVPQVVCVFSSLPHRLRWVPILLLPWETELSVHQLLQHPSLQRAPAQETEQFCLGPAARAPHHPPAPQIRPPLGSLLKLETLAPPALSFRPSLPLLPKLLLLCVLLFWVWRGRSSFFQFLRKSKSSV